MLETKLKQKKGKNISTTIYISPELYKTILKYLDDNDGNSFSELVGRILAVFLKFDGIAKHGSVRNGCKKRVDIKNDKNVSKSVLFSIELYDAIVSYVNLHEFTSFSELCCRVLALFLSFTGIIQYSYGKKIKISS